MRGWWLARMLGCGALPTPPPSATCSHTARNICTSPSAQLSDRLEVAFVLVALRSYMGGLWEVSYGQAESSW